MAYMSWLCRILVAERWGAMRGHFYRPTLSINGLSLFSITVVVNLCFRFSTTSDVGLAILLSVANALFLLYTLPWSLMGLVELRRLLGFNRELKFKFSNGKIGEEEYKNRAKSLTICFTVNISYLIMILFQLGYVIYFWNDELNI